MVQQLNYHHLRYFYVIAREGSIANASQLLHLSPQTLSGQLSVFEDYLGAQLFERRGRSLVLNQTGKLVYSYAEDIFALGSELQLSLNQSGEGQTLELTTGVVDVIPKILAATILQNSFDLEQQLKLVCREGDFDTLLADLALNKIDFILSDRPLTPGIAIKAYSHFLGECGFSFFAAPDKAAALKQDFPESLHQQPFLISGDKSNQKINILSWFDMTQIQPVIVAEFDDSALMKIFGQSGVGVFTAPSIIESHVTRQYDVEVIGRTDAIKERFYAISPERKIKHPGVKYLIEQAQQIFN